MTEKPVTTGVFDTLPDAADLPRIMSERDCIWHDDAIRYGRPCPVVDCTHPHTGSGPFVATSIDTRTRAQMDDGCVTGCSCNGTVTSPKG